MKRQTLIIYIIAIHMALIAALIKTDAFRKLEEKVGVVSEEVGEITPFYERILRYHKRISGNAPPGAVQFIGDSFIQGLCVSAVANPAINYGIGGDTTYGMLQRISEYTSLKTARAIVLAAGFNDMWRRDNAAIAQNYSQILRTLPANRPVLMTAVFPVDERLIDAFKGRNARIADLNARLMEVCAADQRCRFIDINMLLMDKSGNLAPRYYDGDGLHLNSAGNAIWIEALRLRLATLRPSTSSSLK